MNCKFINVLVFAAGAAIGSAVTWKVVKTKYERIIQEEVDSFKEDYAKCMANIGEQDGNGEATDESEDAGEEDYTYPEGTVKQINWDELEDLEEDEEDASPEEYDRKTYAKLVEQYTNEKGGPKDIAKDIAKPPYVSSPYDFGELDDYHQIELTYYADDVLEDDEYNIVNDVDELLGPKALTTFGEYEDDAVFVRNERLRTDFQILKDYRTYAEARSVGPNQVGDE